MNRAIIRRLHNTYTKRLPFTEKLEPETDLKKDCDYISPADRVSNIRRIRYGKRIDETPEEMALKLYSTELHEWNHCYWQNQNINYSNLKEQFMNEVEEDSFEKDEEVENQMNDYYRTYLLSNREHFNKYTSEWRQANIKLMYLSCRAIKSRLYKNTKQSINVLNIKRSTSS